MLRLIGTMSYEGRNMAHHGFGETVTFDKYQSRARKLYLIVVVNICCQLSLAISA